MLTVPTEMRLDKLTIKAQEALQAAHDLAGARGHQELTPEHLLSALLDQQDGVSGALLRKLGTDPAIIREAVAKALDAQPQVRGSTADIYVGRRLNDLMEDAGAAVEGVQGRVRLERAPPAGARRQGPRRRERRPQGRGRAQGRPAEGAGRGARHPAGHRSRGRGQVPGARQVHARSDRARPQRQAGSGHRPRRGDPPRDAGPVAPHQEQPGPDRRARRRQDGGRRGHRAAHRLRRRARVAQGQADPGAGPGRAHRRAPSTAASSRTG